MATMSLFREHQGISADTRVNKGMSVLNCFWVCEGLSNVCQLAVPDAPLVQINTQSIDMTLGPKAVYKCQICSSFQSIRKVRSMVVLTPDGSLWKEGFFRLLPELSVIWSLECSEVEGGGGGWRGRGGGWWCVC